MLSNLNEKYLLKFISNENNIIKSDSDTFIKLLDSFGVKTKFVSTNPVYDIIDNLEYGGIAYE